jgi:hypothetical protein
MKPNYSNNLKFVNFKKFILHVYCSLYIRPVNVSLATSTPLQNFATVQFRAAPHLARISNSCSRFAFMSEATLITIVRYAENTLLTQFNRNGIIHPKLELNKNTEKICVMPNIHHGSHNT